MCSLGNYQHLQDCEKIDRARVHDKIRELTQELRELFTNKPDSKVIIFVQRQMVANYLAELLNNADGMFRANKFTSIGRNGVDPGNYLHATRI